MTDPHASAITATPLITVAVAVWGPAVGPYVLILFGAMCGCFWALANADAMTRWQAFKLAVRVVMLSLLMTVAVSELISHAFSWQVSEMYVVVSIGIAAMGDKWLTVIESLSTAIKTAVSGLFVKKDSP